MSDCPILNIFLSFFQLIPHRYIRKNNAANLFQTDLQQQFYFNESSETYHYNQIPQETTISCDFFYILLVFYLPSFLEANFSSSSFSVINFLKSSSVINVTPISPAILEIFWSASSFFSSSSITISSSA